uniref:PARP catalytic domain-containing protein n=2 Tax=Clytia hemisphaerica TaxID=252671 RepID=A0A7M5XEI5_9CNID
MDEQIKQDSFDPPQQPMEIHNVTLPAIDVPMAAPEEKKLEHQAKHNLSMDDQQSKCSLELQKITTKISSVTSAETTQMTEEKLTTPDPDISHDQTSQRPVKQASEIQEGVDIKPDKFQTLVQSEEGSNTNIDSAKDHISGCPLEHGLTSKLEGIIIARPVKTQLPLNQPAEETIPAISSGDHLQTLCNLCQRDSDHFCMNCPKSVTLYHGTSSGYIEQIKEEGLRASLSGSLGAGVYFVKEFEQAKKIAECRASTRNKENENENQEKAVVLHCKANLGRHIDLSKNGTGGDSWQREYDSATAIHPPWIIENDFEEVCIKDERNCVVVEITIDGETITKMEGFPHLAQTVEAVHYLYRRILGRCRVKMCSENHVAHFCQLCLSEDSDHLTKHCPKGVPLYHVVTGIVDHLNDSEGYLGGGVYFINNFDQAKQIAKCRATQKGEKTWAVLHCRVDLGVYVDLGEESGNEWQENFDSATSLHPRIEATETAFQETCVKDRSKCFVMEITQEGEKTQTQEDGFSSPEIKKDINPEITRDTNLETPSPIRQSVAVFKVYIGCGERNEGYKSDSSADDD